MLDAARPVLCGFKRLMVEQACFFSTMCVRVVQSFLAQQDEGHR